MRARGMTYDTGFVRHGDSSRQRFDPQVVERELTIIRDDLHCDAVQIIGGDPERLELAARIAAGLGLEVWFSPYPLELPPDEIRALLVDCAHRAERLRVTGAEIVLVAGVELSIMNRGFVDGADDAATVGERVERLLADDDGRPARIAELRRRLDAFLRETVPALRERFHGRITYAAIQFEGIDWELFDVVTYELIRSKEVAGIFREAVRSLTDRSAPVAITGFGCAAWRGAGDVAPRSMEIVEHDPATGRPLRLTGEYERDEDGQARYLEELLDVFDSEGVDSAFVFLFALEDFPHRPGGDPRADLDLAGPGIVKVLDGAGGTRYPDMPWEPKRAFDAVAARYARSGR